MSPVPKKIVLFIVEGPTDRDALDAALKRLYPDIRFMVMHGDFTADYNYSHSSLLAGLGSMIKKELARYGTKSSDVAHIIHLMDLDGAYIPENHVLKGTAFRYEPDCIRHPRPESILRRNRHKARSMDILAGKTSLAGMPYAAFYFARNLEHVLHDCDGMPDDDEKEDMADEFAELYENDPEGFLAFFESSAFSVPGDYSQTWSFIRQQTHSLGRFSNFHLALRLITHLVQPE